MSQQAKDGICFCVVAGIVTQLSTIPPNELIAGHLSHWNILPTHHHYSSWNATLHVLFTLLKSHVHGLKYKTSLNVCKIHFSDETSFILKLLP